MSRKRSHESDIAMDASACDVEEPGPKRARKEEARERASAPGNFADMSWVESIDDLGVLCPSASKMPDAQLRERVRKILEHGFKIARMTLRTTNHFSLDDPTVEIAFSVVARAWVATVPNYEAQSFDSFVDSCVEWDPRAIALVAPTDTETCHVSTTGCAESGFKVARAILQAWDVYCERCKAAADDEPAQPYQRVYFDQGVLGGPFGPWSRHVATTAVDNPHLEDTKNYSVGGVLLVDALNSRGTGMGTFLRDWDSVWAPGTVMQGLLSPFVSSRQYADKARLIRALRSGEVLAMTIRVGDGPFKAKPFGLPPGPTLVPEDLEHKIASMIYALPLRDEQGTSYRMHPEVQNNVGGGGAGGRGSRCEVTRMLCGDSTADNPLTPAASSSSSPESGSPRKQRARLFAPSMIELMGGLPRPVFKELGLAYPVIDTLIICTTANVVVPLAGLLAHLRHLEITSCGPRSVYAEDDSASAAQHATGPIRLIRTCGMPVQLELVSALANHPHGAEQIEFYGNYMPTALQGHPRSPSRGWTNQKICILNGSQRYADMFERMPSPKSIIHPCMTKDVAICGFNLGGPETSDHANDLNWWEDDAVRPKGHATRLDVVSGLLAKTDSETDAHGGITRLESIDLSYNPFGPKNSRKINGVMVRGARAPFYDILPRCRNGYALFVGEFGAETFFLGDLPGTDVPPETILYLRRGLLSRTHAHRVLQGQTSPSTSISVADKHAAAAATANDDAVVGWPV